MHYPIGQWATEPVPLEVDQQVRLGGDKWRWTVRAVSEHYAVLVQQARFHPVGTYCYTVIDWRNGVRGACNLIGHGYGDGTFTRAECARMVRDFETGRLEVSRRNWTRIGAVRVLESAS
jgi:hypothetical protein